MIRMGPADPHDAAEEEKKMREIVITQFVSFFVVVGLIKLVPHVIQAFKD